MNHNNIFMFEEAPKPLTDEELNEYFIRMEKGDKEARDEIIKHNMRLVINEVRKKFFNTCYDPDELVSVGFIGLIKSVDGFDKNKNIKFSSYSERCIYNEIVMFLRKNKRHINNISINTVLIRTDDNKLTLEETLKDDTISFVQDYEDECINKEIRKAVSNLSLKGQGVIKLYFGFDQEPMNQREIAKLFGISQSYISRLLSKNIKELKLILQSEKVIDKISCHKDKTLKKTNY